MHNQSETLSKLDITNSILSIHVLYIAKYFSLINKCQP